VRLRILAASALLATAGTLALTAAPAAAAPGAPTCYGIAGSYGCVGDSSPGGPYTWTITELFGGAPSTVTTPGNTLNGTCFFTSIWANVTYSYTLNGVVVTSGAGSLLCTPLLGLDRSDR
jgi:hypothetical protein